MIEGIGIGQMGLQSYVISMPGRLVAEMGHDEGYIPYRPTRKQASNFLVIVENDGRGMKGNVRKGYIPYMPT